MIILRQKRFSNNAVKDVVINYIIDPVDKTTEFIEDNIPIAKEPIKKKSEKIKLITKSIKDLMNREKKVGEV